MTQLTDIHSFSEILAELETATNGLTKGFTSLMVFAL